MKKAWTAPKLERLSVAKMTGDNYWNGSWGQDGGWGKDGGWGHDGGWGKNGGWGSNNSSSNEPHHS